MVEVLRVRIQTLNGCNIVKQRKMDGAKQFRTIDDMNKYRARLERFLQRKSEYTVSVLFDYYEAE